MKKIEEMMKKGIVCVLLGVILFLGGKYEVLAIQEETGYYVKQTECGGMLAEKMFELKCSSTGYVKNANEWVCYARGHIDYNHVANGWYSFPHDERCSVIMGYQTRYVCMDCGTQYLLKQDKCTKIVEENIQYILDVAKPKETLVSLRKISMDLIELVKNDENISGTIASTEGILKFSGDKGDLIQALLDTYLQDHGIYDMYYAFRAQTSNFKIYTDNGNVDISNSQKTGTMLLQSVVYKHGNNAYVVFENGNMYSMDNTLWIKYGNSFPLIIDFGEDNIPIGIVKIEE